MTKLTYNLCLLYQFSPLQIIKMQINDIIILANNNIASIKKVIIKKTKIMTKDREYLTSIQSLSFNGV